MSRFVWKGGTRTGSRGFAASFVPPRRRHESSSTSGEVDHAAHGPGRHRPQQGRTRRDRHRDRSRPGARRRHRAHSGLWRVPHRPALPRGRHQRRVPLPARARGIGHRGGGRRGRDRHRPRRLRHPQLAGRVRHLPRLPARRAAVLLRDAQRVEADDPGGRHGAVARSRHRRLHREDARPRRPVHEGRPGRGPGGRRPARLRRDGRPRRGHQHRRRVPRRLGGRHRLRRRGRGRHRRQPARRSHARSSPSTSTPASSPLRRSSARRTRSTRARRTSSRRSARTPAASAPTSSSTRSARPRPGRRRSTRATSPAPSCSSACPRPT